MQKKSDPKPNYQKMLDELLKELSLQGDAPSAGGSSPPQPPTLFLHSCCAPCSSYVLEYLHHYFAITVFYYNPNITETEEYEKRVAEQKRLIERLNERYTEDGEGYPIQVQEGRYEPKRFLEMSKGLEKCPEGGQRCSLCYALRLSETAKRAAEQGFDYFATTLTISPQKDALRLNEIGSRLSEQYPVKWLFSDFKKKNGYRRSIELSKEYDLYRQNYCGCIYSRRE